MSCAYLEATVAGNTLKAPVGVCFSNPLDNHATFIKAQCGSTDNVGALNQYSDDQCTAEVNATSLVATANPVFKHCTKAACGAYLAYGGPGKEETAENCKNADANWTPQVLGLCEANEDGTESQIIDSCSNGVRSGKTYTTGDCKGDAKTMSEAEIEDHVAACTKCISQASPRFKGFVTAGLIAITLAIASL